MKMGKLPLCCLVIQLCIFVVAQDVSLDTPFTKVLLREFRNLVYNTAGRSGEDPRLLNMARAAGKIQDRVPDNVPFPCNVTGGRSPEVPESVNRLRPGDIDVIAVMGDSLSAGAGLFATQILHLIVENRGGSSLGGGQGTWREFLTIPNILKEFNPNLLGYAVGDSLASNPESQLNVAESGAMSEDMPFMADYLVRRMRNDSRIDIKKHWKMITLTIGPNDFCSNICFIPSVSSMLDHHKADMIKTLRILRDNLPRTIVYLSLLPHLRGLVDSRVKGESVSCYFTTRMECPCLFALQYRSQRPLYYDIMYKWMEVDEEVASYPEFHTDDFTVEIQPILKHMFIPKLADGFTDMTYMAPDCFHASQKLNALHANHFWNNMLEPIGNKTERFGPMFGKFLCPTLEKPYLTTLGNSL